MIDLTPIVQAVVALLAAIITAKVVPYIKSKTTAEQRAQLQAWTHIGVAAAEQIYSGSGRGEAKKKFVMDFLADKGFTVDASTVSVLIESEVNNLWQDMIVVPQDK